MTWKTLRYEWVIDASGIVTMGPLKVSGLSRALCLDIIHNMKSRQLHGNFGISPAKIDGLQRTQQLLSNACGSLINYMFLYFQTETYLVSM